MQGLKFDVVVEMDLNDIQEVFKRHGREGYFSNEALAHIMELKEGRSMEGGLTVGKLDPVADCLEWAEYSLKELVSDYDWALECKGVEPDEDGEYDPHEVLDALQDRTYAVLLSNDNILLMVF